MRRLLPEPPVALPVSGLRSLALLSLGLLATAAGCGSGGAPAGGAAAAPSEARAVTLGRATPRTFHETLRLQGSLSAKHTALVGPQIPGTLAEVSVREGDRVQRGVTKLFGTDARKLRMAAETARLSVALAEAGIREAQARQAQAQIAADKAAVDYERHKALYAKDAISTDIMERVELGHKQAQAQLHHVGIVVELARQQHRQAELGLRMTLQDLADCTVTAPISGVVAARLQEPGEMAAPGRPVLRLEDSSLLEAAAHLPAQYYSRVVVGVTQVRLSSYGVDLGTHPVAYKSPTISEGNRSFEIRCELQDPPEGAAPGGMVELSVRLGETEDLAVPIAAVVQRGGEDRIFLTEGGRARSLVVTTGARDDEGWLAVRAEGLAPNTPVVVVGQSMLDDGDAVRPTGELAAPPGPRPLPVAPASPETLQVQVPSGKAG